MKIEWRPLAEADLTEIVRYISSHNLTAAYDLHRKITDHVAILADHPKIGRPGRVEDIREFVVFRTRYIVAYRIVGRSVTILRVQHGAGPTLSPKHIETPLSWLYGLRTD